MRSVIIFGLGLLLLPAAHAQTPPDLKAVLKKVSEIYKAATQYEFIGDATCRGGLLPNIAQSAHVVIAFRAPDKYRIMGGKICLGPATGDMGEALMLFDGSLLWTYFPDEHLYYSLPINAFDPDAGGDLSHLGPDAFDRETMSAYRDAADSPADFIREENGSYVVRITPKDHTPVQTWWVDKASYHVVRVDDDESSIVFTTIKLNEPLPDELFKFTPPPDARTIKPDQ
jgi:outer membrane lipoprotein-sorting protein